MYTIFRACYGVDLRVLWPSGQVPGDLGEADREWILAFRDEPEAFEDVETYYHGGVDPMPMMVGVEMGWFDECEELILLRAGGILCKVETETEPPRMCPLEPTEAQKAEAAAKLAQFRARAPEGVRKLIPASPYGFLLATTS